MAREIGFWKKVGTYITPVFTSGVDFLVRGTDKYINFNSVTGESGYGIRDNSGTIEVKSSGGSWSTISTGGGEANTAANLGAGTGIFESKVGVELRFKSLVAGTGMGISSDGTTITLTATSGSGDVVGPASATDDNIATFDTTTGKLIQDGGATIAQVRDRSTHTGTQAISTVTGLQTALDGKAASSHTHTASEVTDFDTEVSNNTDVAANTAARHDAVTKAGTGTYVSLSGQEITADPIDVSDLAAAAVVTEAEGIASNDNDTTLPTSAAVKDYVDNNTPSGTVDVVSNVATSTILGRTTAGSGDSEELTAAQVRTLINVEDGADVTDTANVTAAGALMDSEVTNLAEVKAFDPADYATAAQGTTADSALQPTDIASSTITPRTGAINFSGGSDGDVLTVQADGSLAPEAPSGGGGNTYFNNEYIDSSGADDYGTLTGLVNGSNTTFTVSQSAYQTGTLEVYLNGKLVQNGAGNGWTENTPASGTFDFVTAPESGDVIHVRYQTQTLSSDTVITDATTDVSASSWVIDEDNMASDSATKVPTQQSVKAYVDGAVASGVSDGDKGDITVSASGATWTIDNDVVTYAKMQNVSATDRLLGRDTAGAGDVEELTPAAVRTMLNVEDGADVTDTANVTAAGALMDSEVTNLAAVKAFDPTDYATAAQGATADSALQDITSESLGDLANVTESTPGNDEVLQYVTDHWENQTLAEAGIQAVLSEGAFVNGDKTKLDGIETGADVTDTANVTAAGALMDSEVTNLAAVKAFAPTDYATAAQGSTADSALQPGDVDDTPVNGATTAPVSSNWAYDHAAASNPHSTTAADVSALPDTTPFIKSITFEDPTDSEDITIFYTDDAITITQLNAVLAGGSSTPSVTYTVRHSSDRSATGNEVVTSGSTVTSTTTGAEVTSFNDATIPAGSWVWLETTAQSGTVPEFHLTIEFTRD